MNTYYLIVEDIFSNFEILKEAEKPDTPKQNLKLRIRGPYFLVGENNGNGRRYLPEIAHEQYVQYNDKRVKTNNAFGELDHSDTFDINLDRACHFITKLEEKDNHWMGESEILTGHPCGDIVSSLINHGAKFGISSRSAGKFNAAKTIVENFVLGCFDVVAHPSIGKYVDGILESKEFMLNNHGMIVEKAYVNLEKQLNILPKIDMRAKRAAILEATQMFLKNIRRIS